MRHPTAPSATKANEEVKGQWKRQRSEVILLTGAFCFVSCFFLSFFLVFLFILFLNFHLGGECYKGEGQILRDWKMSGAYMHNSQRIDKNLS